MNFTGAFKIKLSNSQNLHYYHTIDYLTTLDVEKKLVTTSKLNFVLN